MTPPPASKKIYATYESKEFDGIVVLGYKILANGVVIEAKKVRLTHPDYFQYAVDQFQVGDKVTTKLTNHKRLRTKQQNDFYWLYLSLIALSSGHTDKELHIWAKGKFLSEGIVEIFGDKTRKVKSTTKLKILEFVEYVTQIEEAVGVPCPDPKPFKLALTQKEWEKLREDQKARYLLFKPEIQK